MRLLLLFVVLPAVELALLIELGSRFGTLHTLGLIVLTGVVGAWLARRQGLFVVREIQAELAEGRMPADSLVDGVMILVAAALLVTPGVLTDAFGFLCLVPAFRRRVKRVAWHRFERAVREQRVHLYMNFDGDDLAADRGPDEPRSVRDVSEVGRHTIRRPPGPR